MKKKILSFLSSMAFGMTLLILIVACSLAGSLIEQGRDAAWYAENLGGGASWVLALGLDHVFTTWYFIALMGLLCVSLIFCSLARFGRTRRAWRACRERAAQAALRPLSPENRARLLKWLPGRGFRAGGGVYGRNRLGYWGSFITHLGLLVTLVFAFLCLTLPTYEDVFVKVGGQAALKDGTILAVSDFQIADQQGQPDYVSRVTVTGPDGAVSPETVIRVNEPFSWAGHKFYQQSYKTMGQADITYNGQTSRADLEEPCFLTLDGENGISYENLLPDYRTDSSGKVTPVTPKAGGYPNPLYVVDVVKDGASTLGTVKPGETLEVGGVLYGFLPPASYPGIRVKTLPLWALCGLYASFVLLIAGLWLCFFHAPAFVRVEAQGYGLYGPKSLEGLETQLAELFEEEKKEK